MLLMSVMLALSVSSVYHNKITTPPHYLFRLYIDTLIFSTMLLMGVEIDLKKKKNKNKTLFLRNLHYVALITVMRKKMLLVYSHISYIVLSVVIKF